MIAVKTNINQALKVYVDGLTSLQDTNVLLRTCATTALHLMKNRIHEQGLDANGQQIGTYSPGYMKIRTGNYGNSTKVTRGKNKGNLKDAGVFSRGNLINQARPRYNRTASTRVVASLTRQMENDFKVVHITARGTYGLGFTNPHNFDKSQWVEATYKKTIYALTTQEREAIDNIIKQFKNNALS